MKNKKKKANLFLFAILLLAEFFGVGSTCDADSYTGLLITEIMYNPQGNNSDHAKWIELNNASDHKIVLTPTGNKTTLGYKISDLKITDSSNHYLYSSENIPIEIEPGDFLILTNNQDNFKNDYFSFSDIPIIKSAISLTNSSGQYTLTLYNNDTVLDSIVYSNDWGGDDDGNSLEKVDFNRDNYKDNWQESYEDGGTPGKNNSQKPEPVDYSHDIRINELFPAPSEDSGLKEYVELYNYGSKEIDLDGWRLEDKGHHKCNLWETIGADDESRYVIFRDGENCDIALNNTGGEEIYLYDPQGKEPVSTASYDGTAEKDKSWSYKDNNKKWKWTSIWTPGEENKFDEDIEYPEGVIINEVLPNPSGDEEKKEYIELCNTSKEKIDISGWTLKDATKSGKYIFPEETFIKSREFLVVYRKIFDFALNNSGDETVTLLSPNGKKSSSISYDGAKENVSYNFTGNQWRWSKFLTPGKKNKFNNLPEVQLKIDKNIFPEVYANFSVKVRDIDKDKIKVSWNFGDGHKSYLEKTRHKYEKKGKYKASVKVFDGSEEVTREFTAEVKNYPGYNVKLLTICPNPIGNDSENEWLAVKNKSGENVNLKNWSIATGWGNPYNHPIYEDLEIKKGEAKIIGRDKCKFTLHNQRSKIELRYPNGKVADKVKYERNKSAANDELYQKSGNGWIWVLPQAEEIAETNQEAARILGEDVFADNREYFAGGQSVVKKENYRLLLLKFVLTKALAELAAQNQSGVLDAKIARDSEGAYHFTQSALQDHYAVKFFKNIFSVINYSINRLIGDFYSR